MPLILLSKADEEYLQKCATQLNFAYGIIIGQRAEPGKYVIVHLAKNSEEDVDYPVPEDGSASAGPQRVEDINTRCLSDQWLSATKMIPGSFSVLGLFITGIRKEYVQEQSEEFKAAKRLFYNVHNMLMQANTNKNTDNLENEYLYLTYSTETKSALCKVYNQATNGGTFTQLDHRFVEKPFEWITFESNYDFDDTYPIVNDAADKINIETQFQHTIETVRQSLNASEIFLQNEYVDDAQILDSYLKPAAAKGKNSAAVAAKITNPGECLKATLYLPVKCQQLETSVKEYNGTIRLTGAISSRVWCNPKNTLADVKRFIREDILRSLTARIQTYCDGLTEPNLSNNSKYIAEPPRRLYFNVNLNSGSTSTIQFSEYIFRGETPTVAAAQAKQILDLDIEHIHADLEALPEDEALSDNSFEMQTSKDQQTAKRSSSASSTKDVARTMYMLGIAISLLVLIVSILVYYFRKSDGDK